MSGDGLEFADSAEMDELCRRHDIRQVPLEAFEYGGHRYTNLKEAVAEDARRPELPRK